MKITAKVKILSNPEESKKLLETMEVFNIACQEIVDVCFKLKSADKLLIHKEVYYLIREKYGLSAQLAVRCISKACESYKINKNITIVKRVDYFSNYYGVGVFDKKNNSTTFTCATENEANYRYNKLLDDYSNMSA